LTSPNLYTSCILSQRAEVDLTAPTLFFKYVETFISPKIVLLVLSISLENVEIAAGSVEPKVSPIVESILISPIDPR